MPPIKIIESFLRLFLGIASSLLSDSHHCQAAVETCCLINAHEGPGDVLCFLCGEEEIEKACAEIEARAEETGQSTMVLPLYSSLPMNQQRRVFPKAPEGTRKIIAERPR